MKNKLPLFILAFLALGVERSFAYVLERASWTPNRTVVMHLSLPPNPGGPYRDGFASLSDSAQDALNIWNQNLVHMKFAVDRNGLLPPNGDDGDTSVTFSNTIYGQAFGSRVLAVTLVTPRTYTDGKPPRLIEADVIFNSSVTFDSYPGPLDPDGTYDFHRVALHEFGHVVGLDHPDQATPKQNVQAIMNSIISSTVYTLQQDDINGAQALYGTGPSFLSSTPAANLVNLSTRGFVGTGDSAMIGGFIIQGSQPATIILRAIAHSLRAVGISNPLNDPLIELHDSTGQIITTNDDWIDSADSTTIASYHLDPPNSRESAIIATLNPGSYTAVVRAFDNHNDDLTGSGLVELYDLHRSESRAGNISTRGQVLSGDDLLIGGFIIGGSVSKTLVVRALGPSLSNFGVANALTDPTLELRDASGNLRSSNDNWGSGPDAALIQAEGYAPTQPPESALQATLAPGNYTAIVRGVNATGIGLVEVYDLSPKPN